MYVNLKQQVRPPMILIPRNSAKITVSQNANAGGSTLRKKCAMPARADSGTTPVSHQNVAFSFSAVQRWEQRFRIATINILETREATELDSTNIA